MFRTLNVCIYHFKMGSVDRFKLTYTILYSLVYNDKEIKES